MAVTPRITTMALSENQMLVDVDRTYLPGRPELRLNIDRARAADLYRNALTSAPGFEEASAGLARVRGR